MKPDNDNLIAEIVTKADQCVMCGLCARVCPTYTLQGRESQSPRGRIACMLALAKQSNLSEEEQAAYKAARDSCVGCMACEAMCPSKVPMQAILDASRAMFPGEISKAEQVLLSLAKSPLKTKALGLGVKWFKSARVLPENWKKPVMGLPDSPVQAPKPGYYPASPDVSDQGQVALYIGCVATITDSQSLNDALCTMNVLGFGVFVLSEQVCCGALHTYAGDHQLTSEMAETNHEAFNDDRWSAVIYVASGCGKRLENQLSPKPVFEILDFIRDFLPLNLPKDERNIALHLPCSLRNSVKKSEPVNQIVRTFSSNDLIELADACCGAGGSHVLRDPDTAQQMLEPFLDQAECAEIVLSSNHGCAMHLRAGLKERKIEVSVMHPVTWLRERLELLKR